MNTPRRNRARVLTSKGQKKLGERLRSHEADHNGGMKYSLEKLGELTGLDPETVKNVRDGKKADKSSIVRCFESFGLTLEESDHVAAAQVGEVSVDPNFVGRNEAITDLNALAIRNVRMIVIQARGGVGKTTLARKYLQQEFGSFLEFPIAKETKDIASIEGLLEEKLRQLGEEPGREFLVSLDRLKRKLQAERIGILIDNLEPALDSAGKFIEAHRRYVELLRVLSDPSVRSLTLITSRERLREADVTVQHYPLRSLDLSAWEQFFRSRNIFVPTPSKENESGQSFLAALHHAYGGNAKAMDIISGAILEDFSGDVEAYWQANQDDLFIERDLEDLVTKQFDRLQQFAPDAYNLLCRMGCYRYQDVPTITTEGLFCLLWDVPKNHYRRVLKSLQDRSLVDYEDGEFWLHPVVREEAILQLRASKDWKLANQKAANYWTDLIENIISVNDAIKAFEGYHHLLAINDYEQAGIVLLRKRETMSADKGQLDRILCRLGLTSQVIKAINLIIQEVESKYYLSKLYDALAVAYRMIGKIHAAIQAHHKAIREAQEYIESLTEETEEALSKFRSLQVSSSINIGICKLSLWEIDEALEIFSALDGQSNSTDGCRSIMQSCLLFTKSCINPQMVELDTIIRSYKENLKVFDTTGAGYRLTFLGMALNNLGEYQFAAEVFNDAIKHSKYFQYNATKAISLNCLGVTYRYLEAFNRAVEKHVESINELRHVGSLGDLAEAYYQLGLTYRTMGEIEKSESTIQEAVRLFDEMEAPKQVERVRQSMQSLE